MVRRRRNQTDAWSRVAHLSDPWIDFSAWQFTALSRFRALSHFDLQFPRLRQVITRHSESPRSNLLDSAIARIAIGIWNVACGIFAPLPGIALPTNAVHCDGQGLVRLLAYRAVGHGAGLEAFYDRLHRLHFINWNRLGNVFQLHQATQGRHTLRLAIDKLGVFLERFVVIGATGLLQQMDRPRIEQMQLTIFSILILTVD